MGEWGLGHCVVLVKSGGEGSCMFVKAALGTADLGMDIIRSIVVHRL